jgi:hypothetical protein
MNLQSRHQDKAALRLWDNCICLTRGGATPRNAGKDPG